MSRVADVVIAVEKKTRIHKKLKASYGVIHQDTCGRCVVSPVANVLMALALSLSLSLAAICRFLLLSPLSPAAALVCSPLSRKLVAL